MVILFRGTAESDNKSQQALALYAGINAARHGRRTLVIQLMDRHPVEHILIGRKMRETSLAGEGYELSETGIDSLMRNAEVSRIEPEQFAAYSTAIFDTKNLLDVIDVSKKPDFENELLKRFNHMEAILKAAKNIYEDIYILGNGQREDVLGLINPHVDISFTCVPQGIQETILAPAGNNVIMVMDYDRDSAYDSKRMAKAYGVKAVAILPYATGFKDACNSLDLATFVLKNSKVKQSDINAYLMGRVYDVSQKVLGRKEIGEEDPDISGLERRRKSFITEVPEKQELGIKNVRHTFGRIGWFKKGVNGYEVSIKENGFAEEDNDDEIPKTEDMGLQADTGEMSDQSETKLVPEKKEQSEEDAGKQERNSESNDIEESNEDETVKEDNAIEEKSDETDDAGGDAIEVYGDIPDVEEDDNTFLYMTEEEAYTESEPESFIPSNQDILEEDEIASDENEMQEKALDSEKNDSDDYDWDGIYEEDEMEELGPDESGLTDEEKEEDDNLPLSEYNEEDEEDEADVIEDEQVNEENGGNVPSKTTSETKVLSFISGSDPVNEKPDSMDEILKAVQTGDLSIEDAKTKLDKQMNEKKAEDAAPKKSIFSIWTRKATAVF